MQDATDLPAVAIAEGERKTLPVTIMTYLVYVCILCVCVCVSVVYVLVCVLYVICGYTGSRERQRKAILFK